MLKLASAWLSSYGAAALRCPLLALDGDLALSVKHIVELPALRPHATEGVASRVPPHYREQAPRHSRPSAPPPFGPGEC